MLILSAIHSLSITLTPRYAVLLKSLPFTVPLFYPLLFCCYIHIPIYPLPFIYSLRIMSKTTIKCSNTSNKLVVIMPYNSTAKLCPQRGDPDVLRFLQNSKALWKTALQNQILVCLHLEIHSIYRKKS